MPLFQTSSLLLDNALPYNLLQNILNHFLDLPCYLVEPRDLRAWHPLVTLRPKSNPMDYESLEQWDDRIQYNDRMLRRVVKEKKTLCLPQQGLQGIFVPLLKRGKVVGVLESGVFLREVPTEPALLKQWKALRGRAVQAYDPEFSQYVQAISETPVLDAPVVEGLAEVFRLFGAALTDSMDKAEVVRRMSQIQLKVFARALWHRGWLEWQVIGKKFFRFQGDAKALMAWERDELGFSRFPTTVLAAKRDTTGQEWTDWLAAMTFRREALRIAPGLGEMVAFPLNNYGVLLLTSAEPGVSGPRLRGYLEARAADFSKALSRKLRCRVWVGVGRTGGGLQQSYHEAVTALHLAVANRQDTVFYGDVGRAVSGETGLRHKIAALARSAEEGGKAIASSERIGFVQEVLLATRGRAEATRRVFMEALHRLVEILESRKNLDAAGLAEFENQATFQLESALNLNDMVGRFEAGLDMVLSFLEQPASGDKHLRLHKACDAILASLEKPWNLPEAARQFGFSATTFSREFSRFAGMPFSSFLLARRLEKAKRLLTQYRLPLAQVARACGFVSENYFLQAFKKKAGMSPGKFRQNQLA